MDILLPPVMIDTGALGCALSLGEQVTLEIEDSVPIDLPLPPETVM